MSQETGSTAYDELTVEVPREEGEALSARLLELGSVGLQEQDPDAGPPRQLWDTGPEAQPGPWLRVRAWFTEAARSEIEAALAPYRPRSVRWSVEDTDWEAESRARFAPFRVGRFTIAPPWDPLPGSIVITPASGFGTGHHPTTRVMLEALEAMAESGQRVLDVGCGSGILALAAAQLGLEAHGVDVAPLAVEEARVNARQSGLEARFSTTPLEECEPAAGVLANLHAELLVPLAGQLRRVTETWLVLGGIRSACEAEVRAAFAPWEPAGRVEVEGWVSLRFHR
jgi:ribosomal protein L11 methyltransferase